MTQSRTGSLISFCFCVSHIVARRIADGLGEVIPNLETLILTNNHIQELGDLDPLAELQKLTYLSLLSNPVANKPHYRSYVIHKLPSLRILDFRKVKLKVGPSVSRFCILLFSLIFGRVVLCQEKEEARALFRSKKGKELAKEIAKTSQNHVTEIASKTQIGK